MIAKRILQLVIHATVILTCVLTISALLRGHVDTSDVIIAMAVVVSLVPLGASIKLNWILLKKCNFIVKLPDTSPLHYGLIALAPMIVCFAGSLRFYHNDHLSSYSLNAIVGDWWWLPDSIIQLGVGIVGSKTGIYMFIAYVVAMMLIFTMHTLGLFSEATSVRDRPVTRTLLTFQTATGALLVAFVLFLLYHFSLSLLAFLETVEFDPGLLNTLNLGVLFFDVVNLILLALYATWVLRDAIDIWRRNLGPQTSSSFSR